MDRIDLHVEVTPVSYEELSSSQFKSEKSETVRKRVLKAAEIQIDRFKESKNVHANAQMTSRMVREVCQLDETGTSLLKMAMERLQLSARAYDRSLKVARTIADLEGIDNIQSEHLAEAINYRSLDRENWAE